SPALHGRPLGTQTTAKTRRTRRTTRSRQDSTTLTSTRSWVGTRSQGGATALPTATTTRPHPATTTRPHPATTTPTRKGPEALGPRGRVPSDPHLGPGPRLPLPVEDSRLHRSVGEVGAPDH